MDESLQKEHNRQHTYHFFFVHGIFEELQDIEDFINSTDKFLLKNAKIGKTAPDNINPRFHPELQFGMIFPDILWRTTFLHSYFLLESSLDEVCNNLQQTENYNLSLSDIAGNGIFRASVYLKKVCNIPGPFSESSWGILNDYNKLRNIFAHANGIASKKIASNLAKRNKGVLATHFDSDEMQLILSKEFVLKATKEIGRFFSILQIAMQKSIP